MFWARLVLGGVGALSMKIHLCNPGQNLAWYFCQRAGEKQSLATLWNSLFGGFFFHYFDKIDGVFSVWFFFSLEFPSWTGEIFPTNAVIIQSWYIFAVTFNLMNCHFSDKESLIWRLEFLLSRQIGNGGTENCVMRSPKNSTSEARINGNGSEKYFSEDSLQILYLFQTYQWPESSFIFYQEK